jgi:hypothetical protein
MIRKLLHLIALVCITCGTTQGQSAIIVSFEDTTMNAGQTGFIDVYLTGAFGDTLGRYAYEFNITGASAAAGSLEFQAMQSNSEQNIGDMFPTHLGYVLQGDVDPEYFLSMRTDAVTLVGEDTLLSFNDVDIDGKFLLARLELEHVGAISGGPYDFTISINQANSEFDMDFDFETDNSYPSFDAFSGTVTVNSSTAVPEPSSLALLGCVGAAAWLKRRRRIRLLSKQTSAI